MLRSLLTSVKTSLVAGLLVLATAVPSSAVTTTVFKVTNYGSHLVIDLRVTPTQTDSWGDNLLDDYDDELDPGKYVYPLAGYDLPNCVQDIRTTYDDGHVIYNNSVNICQRVLNLYY